jgi:hypothetical protein
MIFLAMQLTSKILLDSVGCRGLHSIQPPAVGSFKRRCQYSTKAKMPQPPPMMPRPGNGNDNAAGLSPPAPAIIVILQQKEILVVVDNEPDIDKPTLS